MSIRLIHADFHHPNMDIKHQVDKNLIFDYFTSADSNKTRKSIQKKMFTRSGNSDRPQGMPHGVL